MSSVSLTSDVVYCLTQIICVLRAANAGCKAIRHHLAEWMWRKSEVLAYKVAQMLLL